MPEILLNSHTSKAEARISRCAEHCCRLMLPLAGLAALLVTIILALVSASPSWWLRWSGASPSRADHARRVDNGAWSVLTAPRLTSVTSQRPSQSPPQSPCWSVNLSSTDASAWLTEKLPAWLAAQRPPITPSLSFTQLQLVFEPGHMMLGVQLDAHSPAPNQILWARLQPRIDAHGQLWTPATHIALGKLALPASTLLPRNPTRSTSSIDAPTLRALGLTSELISVLAGKTPLLTDPSVSLPDGRHVHLRSITLLPNTATLTLETLAAKD